MWNVFVFYVFSFLKKRFTSEGITLQKRMLLKPALIDGLIKFEIFVIPSLNRLRQTTPRQVYKHPVYVGLSIAYGEIKKKITKYEARLSEKEVRISKLTTYCQDYEDEIEELRAENSRLRSKLKRKYDSSD